MLCACSISIDFKRVYILVAQNEIEREMFRHWVFIQISTKAREAKKERAKVRETRDR